MKTILFYFTIAFIYLYSLNLPASFNELKDRKTGDTLTLEHGESISGHGRYIIPNEPSTYFFEPTLTNKKGVLIAVGSFRALIDFAMGAFDYAIFLDFDRSIAEFHRAHLTLIESIALRGGSAKDQRMAYLQALHNLGDKKDVASSLGAKLDLDKQRIKSLIDSWKECSGSESSAYATALKNIYSLKEREETFDKWLCNIGQSLGAYYHQDYLNTSQTAYFWEDDMKWQRVVSAIAEKRIAIVSGKVDDSDFFQSINSAIVKLNTAVSVIDLSNIPSIEWLSDVNVARRLTRNIFDLPRTEDAVILYTAQPTDLYPRKHHSVLVGEDISWKYLLLPRDKFFYIGKIFD